MTLKTNINLIFFFFLVIKVVLSDSQVLSVNRHLIDSFRVGDDGCTNDASVCTSSAICNRETGFCECSSIKPNFRNPAIISVDGSLKFSNLYGCVNNEYIRLGVGALQNCSFEPFQLIPYSHKDSTTLFNHQGPSVESCSLMNTQAKSPDHAVGLEFSWVTDSYVDLSITNNSMYFKWKISVPDLKARVVTFNLNCSLGSGTYRKTCLRAKVFGSYPELATSITSITPTVITTQSTTSSSVKTEKASTSSSTGPTSKTGLECISDSNTALIAVIAIAIVVIIVLGIVVAVLWKKLKRLQSKQLKSEEIKRKGGQGRANDRGYDAVVIDPSLMSKGPSSNHQQAGVQRKGGQGRKNEGGDGYDPVVIDPSFKSTGPNNYEQPTDRIYEEMPNYEPLRRNLQDMNDHHIYQGLTKPQKGSIKV